MRVAKIVVEAPVASFRYPHFLIARQVSFDMPPPSTIYGHISSAVGELIPPQSFSFGYCFEFQSRGSDLEHQHIISAGGARQAFDCDGSRYPVSTEAVVQPHHRDFLFKPRLTLYLDRLDLADAFMNPVFCVALGRSQDLAAIVSVEQVELESGRGAYLENTLLPFSMRPSLSLGITVLMPRYIEPPPQRRAHFDRFISLRERVFTPGTPNNENLGIRCFIEREDHPATWWIDPSTPQFCGVHRAVVFHSCASA